jgi:hypothetical protein
MNKSRRKKYIMKSSWWSFHNSTTICSLSSTRNNFFRFLNCLVTFQLNLYSLMWSRGSSCKYICSTLPNAAWKIHQSQKRKISVWLNCKSLFFCSNTNNNQSHNVLILHVCQSVSSCGSVPITHLFNTYFDN